MCGDGVGTIFVTKRQQLGFVACAVTKGKKVFAFFVATNLKQLGNWWGGKQLINLSSSSSRKIEENRLFLPYSAIWQMILWDTHGWMDGKTPSSSSFFS